MRVRKKPVEVDAITFDELVQYGRDHGANIVNGMPWSFDYVTIVQDGNGNVHNRIWPITHEKDDCYLIQTLEGTMKMGRHDMLITGIKGEIYPCKPDIFSATYDEVGECGPNKCDPSSEIARLRADVARLREAIAPVVAEINNRWSDVHDESWNADYHCEFEMTVAECRTLLKALEQPCKP